MNYNRPGIDPFLLYIYGVFTGLLFCCLIVWAVDHFNPEALSISFPRRPQVITKIHLTDDHCRIITETQNMKLPKESCGDFKAGSLITVVPQVISNE